MDSQSNGPRIIVVGNEKGGAGKSTLAIHIACGLLHDGHTVATLDLDLRQQSMGHFFNSRAVWAASSGASLPMPVDGMNDPRPLMSMDDEDTAARLNAMIYAATARANYVLIDTPGSDTVASRVAHSRADLVVTPMNDSFVDFDMLGTVDPVTLDLVKPSVYSEVVWESRKRRMVGERKSIDWLVLRNRLATTEARNRRRLDERLQALSRRVGFRIGPGLRDRVNLSRAVGLTVADLSPTVRPVPVSLTHLAARQELRAIMGAIGLPGYAALAEAETDEPVAEAV